VPPDDQPGHADPADEPARRNVELLVERNRQDTGVDYARVEAKRIRTVAIVGAGMMGTAIAAAHVRRNLPVVLTDIDEQALAQATERVAAELAQQDQASAGDAASVAGQWVEKTTDPARVARCDLILESVVETLSVKQQVYARFKPHLAGRTILASNTSTIPIRRLAAELDRPGQFCGIHFFHPVRHRSLVEIVRGPQTADPTIAAAVAHAKTIDKMPIVVDDGPGFVVNRLLVPYLNEALEMLLEGATIDQIEQAATQFGMAMGPLRILDEIGLDTAMLAGQVLWDAFPERVVASPLLVTMLKKGRLGRKSGAGFFAYSRETPWDGAGEPDPGVDEIIAQWARRPQPFTSETITSRLILPMVLEATRLLEERRVRDPRDVDLAVIFGLGFPASRGGLLYWADALGADRILHMLKPLRSLGPRLEPTQLLRERARRGRRFYDWHAGQTSS
jgi:3-hydroxyacyl-CoA dehydrogenase